MLVVNRTNQVISMKLIVSSNNLIEVMGKCIFENTDYIALQYPQLLSAQNSGTESPPKIALLNFMVAGNNERVEIYKSQILAIALASETARTEYEKVATKLTGGQKV